MRPPLRAVHSRISSSRRFRFIPRLVVASAALMSAVSAPARAGQNPDARFAIDLRAGSTGVTCASLEMAYPSCQAFSREIAAPGEFEAVIVLYNFTAARAVHFTLRWPAGWRIDQFSHCGDLMIGGDVGTNPMPVNLAWVDPRISPGGSGGIPLGILRGEATSPGCIEILGPDEGDTPILVDVAYQTDEAVEWFDCCAGFPPTGDPCGFSFLRAAFDVLSPVGTVPHTATFIDRSTGAPVSWAWEFGDGATSTLRNPVHEYNTCGRYDVRLAVSSATAMDDTLRPAVVEVTGPSQAAFTISSPPWCLETDIFFTDTSTGGPRAWAWDFGDNGTSTEQNPRHRYLTADSFLVRLAIDGPCGPSSCTGMVYVSGSPVAGASYEPMDAHCVPHAISFHDHSAGNPTAWLWEFGDGETSEEPSPVHRYLAPGVYAVHLTAMNGCGSSARTPVATLSFESLLMLHFNTVPDSGCAPLAMEFTPSFEGIAPDSQSWDFGDGGTSSERRPIHTYTAPGLYTVTLTAYAACGVQIERKSVFIDERPDGVYFTGTTRYAPNPPLSVTFEANSARTATYYWSFGDGATGVGRQVTHVYTSPGIFDLRLTAATSCSTVVKKPRYIKVGGANDLAADGEATTPAEGGTAEVTGAETAEVFLTPWLGQPAPVPSTGPVAIEFGVPADAGEMRLLVYDSRGRRVMSLASGALAAGRHRIEWDGAGVSGRVPPGVYFLRMETNIGVLTRKLVLSE